MVDRRALAALLAAAGFVATAVVYRDARVARVDFERGYEGAFVDGFHPRERAEGRYFRWTDDASFVLLENLPSRGTLPVEARLRTVRPAGAPLPELAFTANGVTVYRVRAEPGIATYRFEIPMSSSTLRLGIESETFEASGGRRLGVQVLDVSIAAGGASWLGPALWMAAASVLWFFFLSVSGLPPIPAAAGALGLEGLVVSFLGRGPVPYSGYPRQVVLLGVFALTAAGLLRFALGRLDWLHPRDRARVVAALALLLVLKIGLVTYPLMLSSDADFQANRMSELLRSHWHPTSVTQHEPPFRIPYPVSLFVTAAPLAKLGLDRVTALELTTAVFDVLVSGLLVLLAWRFFDDLRAGLLAAFLYQLVPMNGLSFSAGNFTNVFAVSMLALGFTLLVLGNADGDRRAVFGAGVAAFVALTAHFGLLLEGAVLWPLWVLGLFLLPVPVKDVRRLTALVVVASFALAGLYYLGYWDLVAGQWERALAGREAGGGAAIGEKLAYVADLLGSQVGWVFLATALLGSVAFVRRPLETPFHMTASVWLGTTALFFFVGLVSPIEIRYWLQVLPLLALGSGLYLSRALDRGGVGRIAAIAATLYIAAMGLKELQEIALLRYH